ncbi:MAG TPA: hypothetical protein P5511_05420, partial [Candidatus Goldiibacteriota bacterium]|nr:hypothetical protein [Candidatus Goldiibacteriota bacterium]
YEPFPAKRFYGDEGAGVPCSARFEGKITVDDTGYYEFYLMPYIRGRIAIAGEITYDSINGLKLSKKTVYLKAGEKLNFTSDILVLPARLGINTFAVLYRKNSQDTGKIAPFEWFSPY